MQSQQWMRNEISRLRKFSDCVEHMHNWLYKVTYQFSLVRRRAFFTLHVFVALVYWPVTTLQLVSTTTGQIRIGSFKSIWLVSTIIMSLATTLTCSTPVTAIVSWDCRSFIIQNQKASVDTKLKGIMYHQFWQGNAHIGLHHKQQKSKHGLWMRMLNQSSIPLKNLYLLH